MSQFDQKLEKMKGNNLSKNYIILNLIGRMNLNLIYICLNHICIFYLLSLKGSTDDSPVLSNYHPNYSGCVLQMHFLMKENNIFKKIVNSRSSAGNVQDGTSIQSRTQGQSTTQLGSRENEDATGFNLKSIPLHSHDTN